MTRARTPKIVKQAGDRINEINKKIKKLYTVHGLGTKAIVKILEYEDDITIGKDALDRHLDNLHISKRAHVAKTKIDYAAIIAAKDAEIKALRIKVDECETNHRILRNKIYDCDSRIAQHEIKDIMSH